MGMRPVILFDALPIWRGVQHSPTLVTAPFSLSVSKYGFIRQTSPQQILQDIISGYSGKEYEFITTPPGTSSWSNRLGDTYIEFVESVISDFSRKKILEIGAGSTYIAEYFLQKYRIPKYTIVDPAVKKVVSRKKNLELVHDYFHTGLIKEKYDIVLSFNTLEHVLDPVVFLRDIKKVLHRRSGKIILVFPTIERQFLTGDFNALLHEHLIYFTKQTALALFTQLGLSVLEEYEDDDTLFFSLEPRMVTLRENRSKDNLLFLGKKAFSANLKNTKEILLRDLSSGKRIAFHGACNGLNNFLFLSSLEHHDQFFLFDGDSSKIGKFLPVLKKPILSVDNPIYKTCDVVYVAASTFFDEIRSFLLRNMHFPPQQVHSLYSPEKRQKSI